MNFTKFFVLLVLAVSVSSSTIFRKIKDFFTAKKDGPPKLPPCFPIKKSQSLLSFPGIKDQPPSLPSSPPRRQEVLQERLEVEKKELEIWVCKLVGADNSLTHFIEFFRKKSSLNLPNDDDYSAILSEMIYTFVKDIKSNRLKSHIQFSYLLNIFGGVKTTRYFQPKKISDFIEKHQSLLEDLQNVLRNKAFYVYDFKKGPFLDKVIKYNDSKMNIHQLVPLIECLNVLQSFFQNFAKTYFCKNKATLRKRISLLSGIHEKIKLDVDRFMFFVLLEMYELSPEYLKSFVKDAIDYNRRCRGFFEALATHAENLSNGKKFRKAQDLQIFAHKLKTISSVIRAQINTNNPLPFNYKPSLNGQPPELPPFYKKNVSATSELIPKGAKANIIENATCNWSDFEIKEELGGGNQAILYKGIYKPKQKTEQQVAIKIYSKENHIAEWDREVYFMDHLKDAPFFCRMLFWRKPITNDSDSSVIVMKLAEGGNMHSKYCSDKWQDMDVKKWMAQLVVAVQYMHARKFIHCNLNLSNILLDSSDNVVVCDFGMSKDFISFQDNTSTKRRGTTLHIPPEIYKGQHASFETDIFALGVIFYHFITSDREIIKALSEKANVFEASRKTEMIATLLEFFVKLPIRRDAPVGAEALFRGMVHPELQKRFTLVQIMKSEYFNDIDWKQLGALEAPLKN